MRECPLGPLMLAVHKLCVVGQAFIVTDVLVQGISVVSCLKRTEDLLLQTKHKGYSSRMKFCEIHTLTESTKMTTKSSQVYG